MGVLYCSTVVEAKTYLEIACVAVSEFPAQIEIKLETRPEARVGHILGG